MLQNIYNVSNYMEFNRKIFKTRRKYLDLWMLQVICSISYVHLAVSLEHEWVWKQMCCRLSEKIDVIYNFICNFSLLRDHQQNQPSLLMQHY